jgi:hypothetical protein
MLGLSEAAHKCSKWTSTSQIHFLIGDGMPSLARTPAHQHSTNAAG